MHVDGVVIASGITFLVGLAVAAWLLSRRRRLPPDFIGRVTADAYLALLRALGVLLAGLALALAVAADSRLPFAGQLRAIAVALVGIGGVTVLARAALYLWRIKPVLDRLREPVPPVTLERGQARAGREAVPPEVERRISNQ